MNVVEHQAHRAEGKFLPGASPLDGKNFPAQAPARTTPSPRAIRFGRPLARGHSYVLAEWRRHIQEIGRNDSPWPTP
jgi:hypothetical protein